VWLPLTPTLSLRERGKGGPVLDLSLRERGKANPHSISPSPLGRGQG